MKTSDFINNALRTSLLAVLFIFANASTLASDYAFSQIPAELLVNANNVYRINNKEIIIDGPESYTVKREIIVTILNEKGSNTGILAIQYDNNSRAKFISGKILDANGNTITRIRKRDLTDISDVSDFSLFEDNRILKYVPRVSTYPYTVSYEYEISYNRGLYYAMFFFPAGHFNSSAQKASFKIEYPADHKILFEEFRFDGEADKKQIDQNRKQLLWRFENTKAIPREYMSPSLYHLSPAILFASGEFEFDGYFGTGNSWQDFGKWVWELKQGRDKLPIERVLFFNKMVKNYDNDKDKVKLLYKYLQSNTRYVNISLGIGGLQPIDANTVDKTGYGDCKALTNYMRAILKSVGINSYYTLIKAGIGAYDFFEDFSVNQFNHVILCVPLENDTIWLECTNQLIPFGYLGNINDNRHVLIINEKGGYLTKTPANNPEENMQNLNAIIRIDENGHGNALVNIDFAGIYISNVLWGSRMSYDEQKKWLYQNFSLPNYTIENHNINIIKDSLPTGTVNMEIFLRSFATMTGQRMFVTLNPITATRSTPPRNRNRKNPFELTVESSVSDTISFIIPQGYVLESTMPDYYFESQFGKYHSQLILMENEILYVRNFKTYAGFFPAEKYQDYFNFYQQISRADNHNLVFIKE